MYFTKKRFSFEAFDGKSILSVQLDYPTEGDGFRFEYLSVLVDKCLEFASGKLYDAVKNKYLSEYNERARFARYHYELNIVETYADVELFSYLISVTLRCGTNILSQDVRSAVFYRDMIIPPKLISRGKYNAIVLNDNRHPVNAEYRDGKIVIEKIVKKKYSSKTIKPSAE